MNAHGLSWLLAGFGLALPTSVLAADLPVARVLEIKGNVAIGRSDLKPRPAEVYGTIYANEKLAVEKGARISLAFHDDGHIERLVTAAKVTATAAGCQPKEGIELVEVPRQSKKVFVRGVKELPNITLGGVTVTRGPIDPNLPPRLTPVMASTILSAEPALAWPPVSKALSYEVVIKAGPDRIWEASKIPANQQPLKYAGKTPLTPGDSYTWEVKAIVAGKNLQVYYQGEFTVATKDQMAEAAELRELAKGPEIPLLSLAAMRYEQNELVSEAIETYQRLVDLVPERAPYWAALADLYARAGRGDDAARARTQAEQLGFQFTK